MFNKNCECANGMERKTDQKPGKGQERCTMFRSFWVYFPLWQIALYFPSLTDKVGQYHNMPYEC